MRSRAALMALPLALLLSVSALAQSSGTEYSLPAEAADATEATDARTAQLTTAETPEAAGLFAPVRSYERAFSDVAEGAWYAPAVITAYEYGLLDGRGDGCFAPEERITIAEALTIAARMRCVYQTGSEDALGTAEAGERWYAPYVAYLQGENLLDGRYEGFYLLPASRAQLAGIFAFALPADQYDEPNAALVTEAYASGDYITDVTDETPYRSEILLMYRRGLLNGMDTSGSYCPDRSVTRAEVAALMQRMLLPELRLTLDWEVLPYHSAAGKTLASIIDAPEEDVSYSPGPDAKDTAGIDALVRHMLADDANGIAMMYPAALTQANLGTLAQAFNSCVKTYCEQMYNAVSCKSYSSGRVEITFSSTAGESDTLREYREKTLEAAVAVHDALWESGVLSYEMSEREIAQTYYLWLCDNCDYDTGAANDSTSHLAYGALVNGRAVCDGYTGAYNLLLKLEGIACRALFNASHIWTVATLDGTEYHIDVTWGDQYGRTDLRYFAMSEDESYRYHPWQK